MGAPTNTETLDPHLPAGMRAELETRFYARVNEAARIENTLQDPHLWSEQTHMTWFSDHGVVHVRDVADLILRVLDVIHGVLIPARPLRRFDPFMKTYGVLLSYLHDIGMADFSQFGRAMHPQYAAHAIFTGELDGWIHQAWDENLGNIAWRLVGMERRGLLCQRPEVVFREMLALSMAHSKSKVPAAMLNERQRLRELLLRTLTTDLQTLHLANGNGGQPVPASGAVDRSGPYQENLETAFTWLVAEQEDCRALADDVIDTIRALRSADALRQRGTLQKTSAGYEVFVSLESGNATFSVRQGDDKLYLLEYGEPLSAGEANIASSEVTREGHLRISFHRGAFASEAALRRAVYAAAVTVNDIQADVITSYTRTDGACGGDPARSMSILLEAVEDNPAFVDQVIVALIRIEPDLAGRVARVPSLGGAAVSESVRYLAGERPKWDAAGKRALLQKLAQGGLRTPGIDLNAAFDHVKVASVGAGEHLIQAGHPAGFVYIPLSDGLIVAPLGGYQAFAVRPFMPLGVTGVIRGAARNADIIANQPVDVLIIPKEIYLHHWHHPYTLHELHELLTGLP